MNLIQSRIKKFTYRKNNILHLFNIKSYKQALLPTRKIGPDISINIKIKFTISKKGTRSLIRRRNQLILSFIV